MRKTDFTLPKLDDLFTTQEMRDDAKLERVQNIPLSELHPFKDHPFKVQNNEEMERMIESIRKVGAITPALARPLPDGGYELISGHRRLAACQVLGIETMPVIVREMSDDEAVIAMVDANLQRETILPSEKAFAYKMKLEAIKHQGMTSVQLGQKLLSRSSVAADAKTSETQIQRYIRLTYLIPELLSMVPEKLFERYCENSKNIQWFYKNGDKGIEYFSIVYTDNFGKQKSFYPDYIVGTTDGKVWIIETKGGFTKSGDSEDIDKYTAKKFGVLKAYVDKYKLLGGIVRQDKQSGELCICSETYSDDIKCDSWKLLSDVL